MLFADDATVFAESKENLSRRVIPFGDVLRRKMLQVSVSKNQVLVFQI